MKKIFSILLFLLSFVIVLSISLSRNEVYGMSNAIVANKFSMMGRSYDITKGIVDNVSESNYGVNFFESDWIDEVKNSNVINEVGRTSVESVYSWSLYEFRSKYKLDDKIENSGSLGIDDLFSLDIAQLFDIKLDKVDKTKKANFYYNLEAIYQSYIYDMLYNYSKKDYTDHLDPYYDGYLGLLFRHVIEPSVFFKKFGTHILMRGTFGCEYDINYSVLSSSATFFN